MTQSPHGSNYGSNRPVVMGRNGMVSSGHPLASQAGIAMLQKGGNAVDAALATAAALNVVEPLMSGAGGDGFIMVYQKETGKIEICNGTGAAPYAATREHYADELGGIPLTGIKSVSVPGMVDAWLSAHQRFGSLSLAEVMAPAIDLAANGFPVSQVVAMAIAGDALLCEFPTSRAVFTRDGRPLQPGQTMYQKDLARTLQAIMDGGREAFYEGDIAKEIVAFSRDQGGLLSLEDLADCHCRWQEPISTTYRGYNVYEAPPNSSGHILLQELSLVEQFDLRTMGCNTAESIHLMVEAKKLAFSDREAFMADPEFIDVPIEGLVSKAYAQDRARLIDPGRAAASVLAGNPRSFQSISQSDPKTGRGAPAGAGAGRPEEDTTCFAVVDRWGNAVCQLQSIQSGWGSRLIAGNTGILLNNRMTYWHLDPEHVDCLQPGKRVRHTMNPVMMFRGSQEGANGKSGGEQLVLVCGTPGADTQVQTNLQVITHLVDFGMDVAEAVEAPRWRNTHSPTESNVPHVCDDLLYVESRFPADVRAGLESKGHQLNVVGPWGAAGSEVMIQIEPEEGAIKGAADPRRDGYSIGW